MRELDVMLTRYVDGIASQPNARSEIALIEQFLELQDPELQRYLLAGETPPDPAFVELAARIRNPTGV